MQWSAAAAERAWSTLLAAVLEALEKQRGHESCCTSIALYFMPCFHVAYMQLEEAFEARDCPGTCLEEVWREAGTAHSFAVLALCTSEGGSSVFSSAVN